MTRTAAQAIDWTWQRMTFDRGLCKKMCRTAYGVPSDGSVDATASWRRAKFKHTNGTTPPRGALVWWTGGRKGHGHVAISLGDGQIRTTDLPTSGHWGTASISDPTRLWGLTYEGWSEDIDGVRVIKIQPPPPPPSRLAKLRGKLLAIANDPKVGKVRRARARAAAGVLKGLS